MSRAAEQQRPEIVAEARTGSATHKGRSSSCRASRTAGCTAPASAACRSGRASCSRMTSASTPPSSEEDERGDDVADADLLVIDRARTSRRGRARSPRSAAAAPAGVRIWRRRSSGRFRTLGCVTRRASSAASRRRCGSRQFGARQVELRHERAGLDAPADWRSSRRGCRACSAASPAAIVPRLMRWVRSGPTVPPAGVPRTAVAGAAARHRNVCSPRTLGRVRGGAAGCDLCLPPLLETAPAARRRRRKPYGRAARRNIRCIGRDRCRACRLAAT